MFHDVWYFCQSETKGLTLERVLVAFDSDTHKLLSINKSPFTCYVLFRARASTRHHRLTLNKVYSHIQDEFILRVINLETSVVGTR